jgi:spore germination protein (amino acid permease)
MQLFLNAPRLLMEAAGTAGWILMLFITLIALLIFALIEKLYRKFEGKDLLDIAEHVAGGTGRVIIGLIIVVFFLYIAPVILREFSENIKIISLSRSPLSFVSMFFIVGMFIGAYLGIEAIVRFSAIAVPLVALGLVFVILGSSTHFDFSRIFPLLGNGPYEIFIKGLPRISIYAGIIALFIIYPFVKSRKIFKSAGYTSIILGGIFFTAGVLAFSLVYQYPTGTENFLPIYQLARLINLGRFFERAESVFLLLWTLSALLYLSLILFIIAYVFKKAFKLQYYRPLLFPLVIFIFTLSFIPANLVTAISLERFFRNYAWVVTFLLPVVLLILGNLIKRPVNAIAAADGPSEQCGSENDSSVTEEKPEEKPEQKPEKRSEKRSEKKPEEKAEEKSEEKSEEKPEKGSESKEKSSAPDHGRRSPKKTGRGSDGKEGGNE